MPSEPQGEVQSARLHPWSPLFGVFSAAWRLLLPGIVVLFVASRGDRFQAWAMLLFVPAVAAALLKYLSFRYSLGADELVLREGILSRNERHIPYRRIQNIDQVQNPFHRLLGVAEVRIQTAGGDEPEANMQVLSLRAIEEMRGRVFRDRPAETSQAVDAAEQRGDAAAPAVASASRVVLHLPAREVMLYGIISNRGMAIVAALWGLAWQAGWDDWAPAWLRQWADPEYWMREDTREWVAQYEIGWAMPAFSVLAVVGGLIALLALVRVLSVGWAVLKLHGFTLIRGGDDLRTSFGLFTRRSATVPGPRIQLVTVRETMLHRLFRRAEIRVATAGGKQGGDGDSEVSRHMLVPLLRRERLGELLREVQPQLDPDRVEWRAVDPRAWRRIARRTTALWLAVGLAATPFAGWRAWIAVALLLPAGLAVARLGFRQMGWALAPGAVAYRSGWWVRNTSIVRFSKIQAVGFRQSPFDRRWRMAGVRVDTAGAREGSHRVSVPYLPLDWARGLYDRLGVAAEATEFRW